MKGGKAKEREEKVRRSRERVATEVNRLGLSIASTHTCARARTHAQGIHGRRRWMERLHATCNLDAMPL